jgi:NAD(P)-dependent dehydrogenase (short-subunit alcohol dehydrogenase family)
MSFDNRTYLVTGSLGGIGVQIARGFVAKGARVFLGRRPGSQGDSMPDLGPMARFVELDVISEDAWAHVIDAIVAECGALHGLVNNAAFLKPGTAFTDLTLAEWRQHMSVNLDGAFMGCRLAMQAMAKTGGGSIVNISSGAAYLLAPDAAAYSISKAGVLALTRLAAKAGGRYKVRVNAVLPGAIDTPMLWRNLQDGQSPDQLIDLLTRMHPIGRIGQPIDVTNAVVFLSDPENSFITGAMLAVDGGQLVD